jgi:hypothetical protein
LYGVAPVGAALVSVLLRCGLPLRQMVLRNEGGEAVTRAVKLVALQGVGVAGSQGRSLIEVRTIFPLEFV